MKIAIFTDSFPPYLSGVSTYTIELSKQLIKRGHKVKIFVPDYNSENVTPKGLATVEITRIRSVRTMVKNHRTSLPDLTKVIRELRKFKADILETENPVFLGLDGLLASKILGIPCVSVFHTLATSKEYLDVIFKTQSPILEKAVWMYHQKFYGSSDRIIVFTKEVFDLLVSRGIKKAKIDMTNNFFDFYNVKILNKSEKTILKKYYGLRKRVAVYLGRVSPEKNIRTLIKIWKDVVKEYSNSTLLVIGGGIYEKELKMQILKDKLETNVKHLGIIEHEELLTSGLLSLADVYISASKSETFGLTGIEAMAHKLPVVLFKTQGLSEIVDDAGILCKPDDIRSFKEAVIKIFKNEKLRVAMGKKAREIAGKYNSEDAVDELIEIYKKAIHDYKPAKFSISYLKKISKLDTRIKKYKDLFRIQ